MQPAQKYMSEYKQPDYITKNVPQAVSVTHVKLNYAYVRYTDGNYNMIPRVGILWISV